MYTVTDDSGRSLTLQRIDGRYYPPFPDNVIRNVTSLSIRHDDVILAGYLKAGTHWLWEIIRMLLNGTTDVTNIEKDAGMIELADQSDLDTMESRRVLNTHVIFDQLPVEMLTKKPKMVYLTRNPKDTAVSLYNHHIKLEDYYHYTGEFKDHLRLFIDGKVDYGSWFDHIRSYSEAQKLCRSDYGIDFMELNYEDLTENPERKISELASFLDTGISDQLVSDISDNCNIDKMRERKAKFDLDQNGCSIMYRKGKVGGWKDWFTVSQNEFFDKVFEDRMATIDTPFHWRFDL